MKSTFATLAIAGLAVAAPHINHAAFHKKDLESAFESTVDSLIGGTDIVKDFAEVISAGDKFMSNLKAGWTSVLPATNAKAPTSTSWVGEATEGDAVINTIVNKSKKDATWICWTSAAAGFLTSIPAEIAVAVPAGQTVNVSHAIGHGAAPNSGACSIMFEDDKLNFLGQVANSWFEYTFVDNQFSTFDLSMEANMNGHNVSIAGPVCTSDLNRCSFQCNQAGAESCMEAGTYSLVNCEAGSQKGAMTGTYAGAASGGCLVGSDGTGLTNLVTTLH